MASDRDMAIAGRFDAGETMQSIAGDFGITRERVRQIVSKLGRKAKRDQWQERDELIAAAIVNEGLTARQATERFGMPYATLMTIARRRRVKVRRIRLRDDPDIAARAEKVRNGMSARAASGGNRAIESLITYYCQEHGIASVHGRWRDMTKRKAIIRGMFAAGASWSEIAVAVSAVEAKQIDGPSLYTWALAHVGDAIRQRRRQNRPKRPLPPKPPRHVPVVTIADNLRDAAILNRGKAPASAIAAAHGCTRNAIIGIWYRLRQQGVLA